jgi:hypothetical protein
MLVHLVVLESVKVEDDPLQMHYQNVGSLGNQSPLAHIYFLFASTALVVVDDLAINQLLQTLMNSFYVLHC